MRPRRVLVVGHRRDLESVLGPQRACVVYEGYLERLARAGAVPLIAWPGELWDGGLLDWADAVVLVGGGDVDPAQFGSAAAGDAVDPERDRFEVALVLASRDRRIPLLGVCRGAQVLNVALGGSLREVAGHRQEALLGEPSHRVVFAPGSRLAGLVARPEAAVNSFHRWAVDRLGEGLAATAQSTDAVIEGVESTTGWWAVGVQWHAELLDADAGDLVFRGLVAAARGG